VYSIEVSLHNVSMYVY